MKKLLLTFLFTAGLFFAAFAQDFQVDAEKFIRETQRISNENHMIRLVWWIPVDFWPAVAGKNPNLKKEQVDDLVRLLKDYNIVAVADGTMSTLGDVQYRSEQELRNSISVKGNSGEIYKPLKDEEINSSAKTLIDIVRPMLSNMMGKLGQNIQFFVFPAFAKDKSAVADAKKSGMFTVNLGTDNYNFKLPLESLLKPKKCPVDGQEMSGAWLYCPWHGVKLE